LIDHVSIDSDLIITKTGALAGDWGKQPAGATIELSLIPLAHLRSPAGTEYLARKGIKESYYIKWFDNRKEIEAWQNATRVNVMCNDMAGDALEVEVQFVSSEIRMDKKGYTTDRRKLLIDCKVTVSMQPPIYTLKVMNDSCTQLLPQLDAYP
jgi:hypothetical protein